MARSCKSVCAKRRLVNFELSAETLEAGLVQITWPAEEIRSSAIALIYWLQEVGVSGKGAARKQRAGFLGADDRWQLEPNHSL